MVGAGLATQAALAAAPARARLRPLPDRTASRHLPPQITLRTITDVSLAIDWLRSTYLYTRIKVRRSRALQTCLPA